MKTSFFKIAMPVVAVLMAVGGSLAGRASEKSVLTLTNGYIPNSNPCINPIACSDTGSQFCTVIVGAQNYRLYGKIFPADTQCLKVVYRP